MVFVLPKDRPLIMGIVNVTPDSFSGDGAMAQHNPMAAAADQALHMLGQGADIVDIGGESSRPGAVPVPADEELRRVMPVIESILKQSRAAIIAVDTTKAAVAKAALGAGALIINDISALASDSAMAAVVAEANAFIILMHNRADAHAIAHDAKLGGQYAAPIYQDIIADVARDLSARITHAKKSGIDDAKIILDPGLGFGKTVEQNLALINHLDALQKHGYPLLVGPSRKGFIGRVLDQPVDERLAGTAATVACAVLKGAAILRVHDVPFMAQVAKMAFKIRQN